MKHDSRTYRQIVQYSKNINVLTNPGLGMDLHSKLSESFGENSIRRHYSCKASAFVLLLHYQSVKEIALSFVCKWHQYL